MKTTYILGIDAAKHKIRAALRGAEERDPGLKAFYQRKRSEGKTHHVALSHLMRILTRRLVAVLRSGQPYQSHYHSELKNAA